MKLEVWSFTSGRYLIGTKLLISENDHLIFVYAVVILNVYFYFC